MSRIKGRYISGTNIVGERWLDARTGVLYHEATGNREAHDGFQKAPDGTWVRAEYVWRADPAPVADWYVLRLTMDKPPARLAYKEWPPMYSAFGPYTEAEARANAELRSEKSTGPLATRPPVAYAVVQLLPGNSVVVTPPEPPKSIANWS